MASHRVQWSKVGFLLMASVCLLAFPASSKETKSSPGLNRDQIDRRVHEIQPTAKELRFDAIGWVSGLRAAEKLAREKGRPDFLFSNVGQMDTGRC
jgi:hypothetical protein